MINLIIFDNRINHLFKLSVMNKIVPFIFLFIGILLIPFGVSFNNNLVLLCVAVVFLLFSLVLFVRQITAARKNREQL